MGGDERKLVGRKLSDVEHPKLADGWRKYAALRAVFLCKFVFQTINLRK